MQAKDKSIPSGIGSSVIDFFKNQFKDYPKNYGNIILESLECMKGGAIVFFLIIIYYYIHDYSSVENRWYSGTLFNSKGREFWAILLGAFFTSFYGAMTIFLIFGSRKNLTLRQAILPAIIVFIILFAFDVCQEASGFNKYIQIEDVLSGNKENVYVMNFGDNNERTKQIFEKSDCQKLAQYMKEKNVDAYVKLKKEMHEQNRSSECSIQYDVGDLGNPFLNSLSRAVKLLLGAYLLYKMTQMIIAAGFGYFDEKNKLGHVQFEVEWFNQSEGRKQLMFAIEVLFFNGFINIISPMFSPMMVGQNFANGKWWMPVIFFVGSCGIHIIMQYGGFYRTDTDMDKEKHD